MTPRASGERSYYKGSAQYAWRLANWEKQRLSNKSVNRLHGHIYRRVEKHKAVDLLGGCCAFCGETDIVVLQFDHKVPVHHDRSKGRGLRAAGIMALFRRGEENPFNLQVLCANCHMRKTAMERARLGP